MKIFSSTKICIPWMEVSQRILKEFHCIKLIKHIQTWYASHLIISKKLSSGWISFYFQCWWYWTDITKKQTFWVSFTGPEPDIKKRNESLYNGQAQYKGKQLIWAIRIELSHRTSMNLTKNLNCKSTYTINFKY